MSFLYCTPTVFVVGNEYEILAVAEKNGIIFAEIAGEKYYEENSGVLSSEKNYAKIRVPQSVLNEAKTYTIVYKETINRRSYYSQMGEAQYQIFSFKPLEKTENIHIYHIADVHYQFDKASRLAEFFGDDLDLLVVNGDIAEVETFEQYWETFKFVGDMSKGEIPVIFTRGNHDTRGKLAEKFTDYYPANGKNTYYAFELGCLSGVVLDCGEDKRDDHLNYDAMEYFSSPHPEVYGGVNVFSSFRQRELRFLESLRLSSENKITFAISHICPVRPQGHRHGDSFDIERECYTLWNKELERLGIKFMLTGHIHRAYILLPDNEEATIRHNYPIVIGSGVQAESIIGAAITLNKTSMEVKFTDNNGIILESQTIEI